MSLFFAKNGKLIFLGALIIVLIICALLPQKASDISGAADNLYADKTDTSGSPDTTDNSDNGSGSKTDTSSNSDDDNDSENTLPYSLTNLGQGIGGGCIIGNCQAGGRNLPIYSVDLSKNRTEGDTAKYVSISFDAAWGDDDTIRILEILDRYNIKTTFFMTGGWVESYPDMVKEIYSRGHDLGNHSENHKEMSKLSVTEQREEIMSVAEKIKAITGYESFLFRPPYGDYNSTLIDTVYGCNFYPIEWDVDSLDWKDYGVDSIIKTVTNHKALHNGSIVLMHNGAKYTADALEAVITGLQNQGYTIVPISQLIHTENFYMDTTGCQHIKTP